MATSYCFYGSITVGGRGQIVIPADDRNDRCIQPGDRMMVMKHPLRMGLMVVKIKAAQAFLSEFVATLDRLQGEPPSPEEES
jgi:AbrB family looped-hinge helix DNA binding protein